MQQELNRILSLVLTWTPETLASYQGQVQVLTSLIDDVSKETD